jgi:hypothetical protein
LGDREHEQLKARFEALLSTLVERQRLSADEVAALQGQQRQHGHEDMKASTEES